MTNNNISNFFNRFSENYDKSAFEQSLGAKYLSHIETHFIRKELNANNKKVLDIGIGTGRNSEIVIAKNGTIVGIDISDMMMSKAQKKLDKKKINFMITDAGHDLPFKNGSFDCVICMRVLKYISTWRNSIKEISRILKRDGTFILEIANRHSIQYLGLYDANYFLFNVNDVKFELKRNGFEIIKISSGTRLPFPLYNKIDNESILNIFICIESFLDRFLPDTILSRNILLKCRKAKDEQ